MKTRQEPEGFETYWNIWRKYARHTDGRGLARDAFTKHIRHGADFQDIIDGAKFFFRTMKDKDRDYVPLSATWINRESYGDLAEQERAYQARVAEIQSQRITIVKTENVVDINRPSQEARERAVQRAREAMGGARAGM